jgi:RNA polymerase sigma factor (sigma-70 family)
MDDLIKLVKTYRLTAGLMEKQNLAEAIFHRIEPDLRLFVFGNISRDTAQDALQEVLKGVAISLTKFKGGTEKEFWGWCYSIARNKMRDQFREKYSDLTQPMPPEEIWQLVEASAKAEPLSAGDRHDLEYAMKLLTSSKPECYDLLWKHFVNGFDYDDLAEVQGITYDSIRMKIKRCLIEAQSLVS